MEKHSYRIVIEPLPAEEGGGFLATVPDLPGCMSDGATDVEALTNVHDAIEVWLSRWVAMGRPIPEPTRLKQFA
ncbi:MAG: type II toxin-antitoxin system HicB family antitoxin [Pseudomonadota bacterium]